VEQVYKVGDFWYKRAFQDFPQGVTRVIVVRAMPLPHSTNPGRDAHKLEEPLLTSPEQRVLRTFQQFLMTPGQMLCFYGPNLEQNKDTLEGLTDRDFLVKEKFKGGYSLTDAGFAAMKTCKS
jgi:hypothetical protein